MKERRMVYQMNIKGIQEKIKKCEYLISDHAIKRIIKRSIVRNEIEEAVGKGEIIEEYPSDKYCPSCLIYGRTHDGRDLHVQVSFPPIVTIITVYEPNQAEWIDCKKRR
jgi:hypothetical protein